MALKRQREKVERKREREEKKERLSEKKEKCVGQPLKRGRGRSGVQGRRDIFSVVLFLN